MDDGCLPIAIGHLSDSGDLHVTSVSSFYFFNPAIKYFKKEYNLISIHSLYIIFNLLVASTT